MEDIAPELIKKLQQGSIQAFEEVYQKSSSFVYTLSFRIVGNVQDAQEITQDVFLKVYHKIKKFEFRSSFKTWLYRITTNTAINYYKLRHRDFSRRSDFETVIASHPAEEDIKQQTEMAQEQQIAKEKFQEFLGRLNPDQRACLVLREIEGLSYQEIAQTLSCNLNTVRTRLKRARQALMRFTSERIEK
ncbi:MAG: RNA polymerase sigma factor [Candidatus Omnitrophica bacterium]|nr:RNA polymerase sigma factor [Candidatus Omnitrophota bacterium]